MHPYLVLKALHVAGVLLAFTGVAGIAAHAASGRPRAENPLRRRLAALHGVGLLLVLLAGIWMVAQLMRTPNAPSPAWVTAKLVLWVLLAGMVALPYRRPEWARRVLVAGLPLLAVAAAVVAVLKPF
jgi:uncharacterized membrane protein SirB2